MERQHRMALDRGSMTSVVGNGGRMRIGDTEVRFLGGAPGCLAMLAISILASVLLTVILNLALR
jgi:hypothetical protein